MSTNLFDIPKEDAYHILEMHKTATKNLYLLKEQTEIKKEERKIPLNVNWETGKWKLTTEQINSLSKQLIEITNFINEHKGSRVKIQIRAGESQITNYDREVSPKQTLDIGELSNRRGTSLVNFLKGYFDGLLKKGVITEMPEIPEPETKIGETKYTGPKDLEDEVKLRKYKSEQFVEAIISLEKDYDCVAGMKITVGYFPEKGQSGHDCDEAIFELKVNGISLGEVNLNNGNMDFSLNNFRKREENISKQYQAKLKQVEDNWNFLVKNGDVKDNPDQKKKFIEKNAPSPETLDYPSWVYNLMRVKGYDNVENFVSDLESINNSFSKYGRIKYTTGGSRSQTFEIDDVLAKKIIDSTNSDKLILSLKPLVSDSGKYKIFYSKGSHSDTPWIIITNKKSEKPIYDGQPNVSMKRGDLTEKVILKTDLCGNEIK